MWQCLKQLPEEGWPSVPGAPPWQQVQEGLKALAKSLGLPDEEQTTGWEARTAQAIANHIQDWGEQPTRRRKDKNRVESEKLEIEKEISGWDEQENNLRAQLENRKREVRELQENLPKHEVGTEEYDKLLQQLTDRIRDLKNLGEELKRVRRNRNDAEQKRKGLETRLHGLKSPLGSGVTSVDKLWERLTGKSLSESDQDMPGRRAAPAEGNH